MRLLTGGVAHISARIEEDLSDRETGLQKIWTPKKNRQIFDFAL